MKKSVFNISFTFLFLFASILSAQDKTYEYRELSNLSYLSEKDVVVDSLQRLNLVLPNGIEQPPLLIWIGGGAWSFVNRHMEMDLARKFAERGIAVASVGHQLSKGAFQPTGRTSGVKHPVHIQDLAAAFKWLYEQAKSYGYDRTNIFVGGFSSGAHLAALLGSDKRYLEAHDLELSHIRGLLPVAGAYDIVAYYNTFLNNDNPDYRPMAETHVKDVFGETEADFTDASPTNYLQDLKAPMLLMSEGALHMYTKVFEERLEESDYSNYQGFHLFNFDHAGLWRDLSYSDNSFARNVMVDFIRKNCIGK